MAARLEVSVRATDMAARLGGEEFVLVMTETDMNTAQAVTARVCRDIEASPFAGSIIQNGLPITGSIGVAITDNRDESADDLIKRADEALYEAKRGGRNQVVVAAVA
jgi:two-component system cell cycle response regulator